MINYQVVTIWLCVFAFLQAGLIIYLFLRQKRSNEEIENIKKYDHVHESQLDGIYQASKLPRTTIKERKSWEKDKIKAWDIDFVVYSKSVRNDDPATWMYCPVVIKHHSISVDRAIQMMAEHIGVRFNYHPEVPERTTLDAIPPRTEKEPVGVVNA